jgi:hypothetical protein
MDVGKETHVGPVNAFYNSETAMKDVNRDR